MKSFIILIYYRYKWTFILTLSKHVDDVIIQFKEGKKEAFDFFKEEVKL